MPEYLAPGVVVEEVTLGAQSARSAPTSTAGFVGRTPGGPVAYPGGPTTCGPRLVTSVDQFERVHGRLDRYDDGTVPYLAHAVRAFFDNGGRRLYVSRVHTPPDGGSGVASVSVPVPSATPSLATFRARWPGRTGNVGVTVQAVRGEDVGDHAAPRASAPGQPPGTLLEVVAPGARPAADAPIDPQQLVVLQEVAGGQTFVGADGATATPGAGDWLLPIALTVTVVVDAVRTDVYPGLGLVGPRALDIVLARDEPDDEDAVVWFEHTGPADPIALLTGLVGVGAAPQRTHVLQGGADGAPLTPEALLGRQAADGAGGAAAADATTRATGLWALAEVDEVAIVAAPDVGAMSPLADQVTATRHLLDHARQGRRFAVVDGPAHASIEEIRSFRGTVDSSYGALYHPWVEVDEPDDAGLTRPLLLPPSGFVAGVLARGDLTRGVSHTGSDAAVVGFTRLEVDLRRDDGGLAADGVNPLLLFEGRGHRVWGNRTLTADPQWRYVTVRRLFLLLEHSIDAAIRWAVFEPNDEVLWARVRRTVEDLLDEQWRAGALAGRTADEAFFVRCDRTTMTQDDLDHGRLVCLVGVAPVRPAEFVLVRIGSWTADAAGRSM